MAQPIKTPGSGATERILSLTNHLKNSLNPADDIQKAKMSVPYKFQGWMGLDKNSVQGKMEWQEFEPKTWTEDDVDIKITHCGVCGSDITRSAFRLGMCQQYIPLRYIYLLTT